MKYACIFLWCVIFQFVHVELKYSKHLFLCALTLRDLFDDSMFVLLCNLFSYLSLEMNEGKMTVGKIYAGLLVAENWKACKARQEINNRGVSSLLVIYLLYWPVLRNREWKNWLVSLLYKNSSILFFLLLIDVLLTYYTTFNIMFPLISFIILVNKVNLLVIYLYI